MEEDVNPISASKDSDSKENMGVIPDTCTPASLLFLNLPLKEVQKHLFSMMKAKTLTLIETI